MKIASPRHEGKKGDLGVVTQPTSASPGEAHRPPPGAMHINLKPVKKNAILREYYEVDKAQ